ncbi:hypothetical protein BJ166DRAFT_539498 [Pestalotiopsis sp. NC0098]|nr:hypothetical protein BJ166DRAFT_539498 [Pestalotiopsis sp. NC0098]
MSQAFLTKTLTSFRKNMNRFGPVRTVIKSQATYHVESVLNAVPYLGWDILSDAHRLQAPIELMWEKIGANHDQQSKSMKKDQVAFVQSLAQSTLTIMPELQGRKFEDRLQTDGKFSSASSNGLFSHLYTFHTDLTIPNGASVIKDGGVYPLWDISHYPDINGFVFADTPEGKAFMEEFERLRLDGNELRALIAKHRAQNMATLIKIIKDGVAPSGGRECYIILGTFGARYRGIHTVKHKQLDGTTFAGQAMLLEPDIRHPFVGWIQHMFLVTGPNTVSAVVLGGGEGKVPFLDCVNSWLAPWLWSLVKIISAHSYRIKHQLTPVGGDLDETEFNKAVAEAIDHLSLQFWIVQLFLKGGPMGAWCQEIFGRAGVKTMTDEEYANWRKRDKEVKALTDAEGRGSGRTHHSYNPDGELDRTTIRDKDDDHNKGGGTNNKKPPNTGSSNTQQSSKSKTSAQSEPAKSPKDKAPGSRPKPIPSLDISNKTTTSLKNEVKGANVQPKRSASTTPPNQTAQKSTDKKSPSSQFSKSTESPTNKQQPSTQPKPSQTPTSKQTPPTQVAKSTQAQTGKQQPLSQTTPVAQPQKITDPASEQTNVGGITIPALKITPGDGFSLTTKEMRAATMDNWRTLEAYFNLSGERAGGKSPEKGPLATTIREKCSSQLNKQKLDVATRLQGFTAPESLPANEFFLKQEIFDQAKIYEVVKQGVEATEALVPVLAKDRMNKIAEMAKAKKVQVPKELGQESVTKMIREACLKLLVYPFGDLHQSGFTANAMDEVAARLAIKQLMFEHQKTDEGLRKIAGKAQEIHGKGDTEAEGKLQAQGEAKQRKMQVISDMIKEMQQRQDRAIKAMRADLPKQTKL